MKNGITWLLATAFALPTNSAIAATDPAASASPELVQLVNSTVICRFKDKVLPEKVPAFVNDIVRNVGAKSRHVYTTAFRGFSAHMSMTTANKLVEKNPNIEFCEPNGIGQAGGVPVQAGARNRKGKPKPPPVYTPQVEPPGVERVGGPIDGAALTAWIIDSGIDLDHADLNVDASRGADMVKRRGKPVLDDVNGHGTHVAGILAAIDNDIDVVGVAAGATVVPVRVLGRRGYGSIDDIVAGIDYVAQEASMGDVANMSIWAWGHYRSLHEAAESLADNIPFIVIAGNDGEDINDRPSEPAHVEHPNLYTVSAIDNNDVLTDFSNYGYADDWYSMELVCGDDDIDDPYPCATVDFAAPGQGILSLQPNGSLAEWEGTSMAAPHVTAVILLLQKPNDTPPTSDGVAAYDPDNQPDPIVYYDPY